MLLLIAQGFVISLLLFSRKKHGNRNKYLAAFVLTIVLERCVDLLEATWPYITSGLWIIPFAIGKLTISVFLYLYIGEIVQHHNVKAKTLLVTTTLFAISLSSVVLITRPILSFDEFMNIPDSYISSFIFVIWSSFFLVKTGLLLRKYKSPDQGGIKWLTSLIIIIGSILLLEVIDDTNEYFGLTKEIDFIHLVDLILLVLIYLISYRILATPTLFYSNTEATTKYSGSSLSEERLNTIQSRLQSYMDKEKPYLNGSLTIQNVADSLGISRQYISQVLNEKMHLNFNDYLNQHRVNEFKNKLNNPAFQHYTILALALESGFNSKTSFNTIFKRHTGNTPSEYKKLHTVNQNTKRSN